MDVCVIVADPRIRMHDIADMRYVFGDRRLCFLFLAPSFYDAGAPHLREAGIAHSHIFRNGDDPRLASVRIALQLELSPTKHTFHKKRSEVKYVAVVHGLSSPRYIDFVCQYPEKYNFVCLPGPSTVRCLPPGIAPVIMGNARGEMCTSKEHVDRAFDIVRRRFGGRTDKKVVALLASGHYTYPSKDIVRTGMEVWAPRILQLLRDDPTLHIVFSPHAHVTKECKALSRHPRVFTVDDKKRKTISTLAYIRVCDTAVYECTSTMMFAMHDYSQKPIVLRNPGTKPGAWGWYPAMEDARIVGSTAELADAIAKPEVWLPEERDKHITRRPDEFRSDREFFKHNLRSAVGL